MQGDKPRIEFMGFFDDIWIPLVVIALGWGFFGLLGLRLAQKNRQRLDAIETQLKELTASTPAEDE